MIEQYKTANEKLEQDLPVLRQVVNSTWKKEDELKELKTEVATLERKIQLSLAPPQNEQPTDENTQTNEPSHSIEPTHSANNGTASPQTNKQLSTTGESAGNASTHSENPNVLVVTVLPHNESTERPKVRI